MGAALIVYIDDGGVRLQVDLVDAGGAELPLDDDLGVTERGIDIAPFVNHAAVVVAEFLKLFDATVVVVVGVDEDGVGLGCFFRVKQRGQFFVGDVDEAEGCVCDIRIVGDDGGDLVADESDAIGGRKDRLIDIQVAGALVRNIVAGEDAVDAGQGEGAGGIDVEDARVGTGERRYLSRRALGGAISRA